jgi:bacteriocin biosynthesis cyclodehydratase domain-containing protein
MLVPYLLHVRSRRGPIFILMPRRTYQLRLPGTLARVAEQVLQRLDGQCTIPQLIEAVQADLPQCQSEIVVALLQYLRKQGMLIDGAAKPPERLLDDATTRWSRNLSFFSGFEGGTRTRYDYQLALQDAAVALIGLGGTGSWAAYSLAMAGVGKIVGMDGDRVEANNLNRQILYRPQDVGRLKAEVASEMLASFAPEMHFVGRARWLRGEDEVTEMIKGCDILLLTADQPMGLITRWSNAACFALRIPLLELGMAAHWGMVGPLYVPGLTGCWECGEARKRRQSRYYGEIFQTLAEQPVSAPPSLAPMCALVGGLAAYEAMKYLTGFARPATLGRELAIDTLTMNIERHTVEQQSHCPVCSVTAEELPHRAAYLPEERSGSLRSSRRALSRWIRRRFFPWVMG